MKDKNPKIKKSKDKTKLKINPKLKKQLEEENRYFELHQDEFNNNRIKSKDIWKYPAEKRYAYLKHNLIRLYGTSQDMLIDHLHCDMCGVISLYGKNADRENIHHQ